MADIKARLIKYTENKKLIVIAVLFILGIILVFIPNGEKEPQKPDDGIAFSKEADERRLCDLLGEVDGVKDVKVMLSYTDKGTTEYYFDESKNLEDNSVKKDSHLATIRSDNGELPVIVREKMPEISGASVILSCNKKVEEEVIYQIVSKALGIEIHKIQIVINDRR